MRCFPPLLVCLCAWLGRATDGRAQARLPPADRAAIAGLLREYLTTARRAWTLRDARILVPDSSTILERTPQDARAWWAGAAAAGNQRDTAPQARPALDSLRTLDSAWARTYATHDTALAIALLAPDLVVTSASGALKDRAGELGDIRPFPGLVMRFFRTSDVRPRVHGETGVVTGLAEWEFTLNGRVNTMRRRYTAVYARGGPLGWRLVALHIGLAPAPT